MFDSLKKIFSLFSKGNKIKIFVLFLMMILASFLEVLGIGVIPAFVVAVADPDTVLNYPILGDWLASVGITTSESLVLYGALLLILVYICKNVYLGFFHYLKKKYIANRGIELQNRLLKAYLTAPYTFYISRNSAELLRNVNSEVRKVIDGTLMPMMILSLNVIMTLFIVALLLALEPLITVLTLFIMGTMGYVFLRYTQKKTNEYGRKDREARKDMNKTVLEGLGGFKDTRILNREKLFLKRYWHHADVSKWANIYKFVVSKLPKPIIETIAVTLILLITLIMIWEGRAIVSIIPTLALFGVAAVRLMPLLNQVISEVTNLRYNAYSVYAVYDDLMLLESLENEVSKKLSVESGEKVTLDEKIELKSLSYRYPDAEEYAVRDVSLTIQKGNAIAFVGHSGAGKTTLVDVILGLLEPENGTIEVDGVDIFKNIRGWQKNIGYIPQSIYLMDDTIRRNIAFGIPDDEIEDQKLENAIQAAQLKELVDRLPEGIHTVVGERGVRISGGQIQRIGIARALYHNPQVLIMDEATSALDNVTEKYVIDAIEKLRGDRTIIMIAHRLTTVQNCDLIHFMKEGRIIEVGKYEELMETSADFREMSMVE